MGSSYWSRWCVYLGAIRCPDSNDEEHEGCHARWSSHFYRFDTHDISVPSPASSRLAPGVRLGSREHHAQVISSGGLLRAGLRLYGCCETPVRHHAAPMSEITDTYTDV